MSAAFDVARFLELRRAAPGLTWAEPLHYAAETGSTNDDALAAARAGAPSGAVFLAEHQTHGRGRRGRSWLAASGQSLLFSVLLRPAAKAAAATGSSALTLAVGLGTRAALAPFSVHALHVKWPNDVLSGRRKLAGVLCETQLQGSQIAAVVIGVGINVACQAFPPQLASEVTCLEALTSRPLSREQLLVDVLREVEQRVTDGETAGWSELLEEFRRHDALRDQQVSVGGARELTGIARGVNAEGQLLLETDGVVIAVGSGTVRWA